MSYAESYDIGSPIQASHWYTQSVVATGGVYKGQGQSRSKLCDLQLQGIPRSWGIIAIPSPKQAIVRREQISHASGISKDYPLLSE